MCTSFLNARQSTRAIETRLRRSSKRDALFQALTLPNTMVEPLATLLASPPHDSAFQIVSDILGPSGSKGPSGPSDSVKSKHDTDASLAPTGILDVEPDPNGGWVIEGEEGPRASKGHRLICG